MSRRFVFPTLAVGFGVLCCSLGFAQPAAPSAGSFNSTALQTARTRAASDLRDAALAIDAALAGDPSSHDAWHASLRWNEWAAPLMKTGDCEPATLIPIASRLNTVKDGVEHPRILALRAAATRFVTVEQAVADANSDLDAEHAQRLAQLTVSSLPLGFEMHVLEPPSVVGIDTGDRCRRTSKRSWSRDFAACSAKSFRSTVCNSPRGGARPNVGVPRLTGHARRQLGASAVHKPQASRRVRGPRTAGAGEGNASRRGPLAAACRANLTTPGRWR